MTPDVSSLILCHVKSPLGNGEEDHVQRQLRSMLDAGGSEGGTWHGKPLSQQWPSL